MGSNGTRDVDGTVQPMVHPIVLGMASPVIITHHTLKVSCWPTITWMAPFPHTFG